MIRPVVLLCGPRGVCRELCVGVEGGCGVEGVDTTVEVDVVDELVEVLEPRVGVLVVEVRSLAEHDVVLSRHVTSRHVI